LRSSIQPLLEDTWYDLAYTQTCLARPIAAERAFAGGLAATREAAAQLPPGSLRRALAEGRPAFERDVQRFAAGEYKAAFAGISKSIALLDDPSVANASGTMAQMRNTVLHWSLDVQARSALQLGRPAEAEAGLRRRQSLPPSGYSDPAHETATLQALLAQAVAGQGRRDEAATILAPALQFFSGRIAQEPEPGLTLRVDYATALFAAALTKPADAQGRKLRMQGLDAAAGQLALLGAEAQQYCDVRRLAADIAAARTSGAR
jgi:hypothetical protein